MADEITPDPVEDTQAAPDEQTPEILLAGKYKSPEELEKAYKSLESKLGQLGEEKASYEAQLEDLYGRVQQMEQGAQQASYDPATDPHILAYEQAMENGDYRAAMAIQMGLLQQMQPQQPSQSSQQPRDYESWAFVAQQTAAQQIGPDEWDKYKEKVGEIADTYPKTFFDDMTAAQAASHLVNFYRMAKADDVLDTQQTLAEQQANADREAKLAAQSMSGASGRPEEPTQDETTVARILEAGKTGTYSAFLGG